MRAVAEIAAEPFVAGSLENQHIVEHPAGHMTLKHLIQRDRDRIQAGQPGKPHVDTLVAQYIFHQTLKKSSFKKRYFECWLIVFSSFQCCSPKFC